MSSTQTTRHTRTPDEMRAQAEALHASITAQVEQLRDSDQWARFLRFAGSFHQYSLNNVLLILAQHPNATAVAGFRAWQNKGPVSRSRRLFILICSLFLSDSGCHG